MKHHHPSKPVLLFGIGVLTGWVVKQLFDSPEVTKKRQELMANLDDIREQLAESDEAQRVKEIFGQVTDEATRMYQETREELIQELSSLRVALDEIDKSKYIAIVTGIIEDLRDNGSMSDQQLDRLQTSLNSDFSKLKRRRERARARRQA